MRRRRDTRRGQTLVEFALILPVFLLLLMGIFDFGRAVYAYNTVANAARQAVRLAIVDQEPAKIQDLAAKQAASLGIDPSAVTIRFVNPDLSTGQPCNQTPVLNGCLVEVTVPYTYTAATPIIGNIVGPISISATSRLPVERTYPYP
jgi:Flp pilus assembly protein TadG